MSTIFSIESETEFISNLRNKNPEDKVISIYSSEPEISVSEPEKKVIIVKYIQIQPKPQQYVLKKNVPQQPQYQVKPKPEIKPSVVKLLKRFVGNDNIVKEMSKPLLTKHEELAKIDIPEPKHNRFFDNIVVKPKRQDKRKQPNPNIKREEKFFSDIGHVKNPIDKPRKAKKKANFMRF